MSPLSDNGFTRHPRRIWMHAAFRSPQEVAVFLWLKDAAQWRDAVIQTPFGSVSLTKGEVLIAERELSEMFGLSRKGLRTVLASMAHHGLISIDRCEGRAPQRAGTVLMVCNYADYQTGAAPASSGTTTEPHGEPEGDRIRDRKRTATESDICQQYQQVAGTPQDDRDRNGTAGEPHSDDGGNRRGTALIRIKEEDTNTPPTPPSVVADQPGRGAGIGAFQQEANVITGPFAGTPAADLFADIAEPEAPPQRRRRGQTAEAANRKPPDPNVALLFSQSLTQLAGILDKDLSDKKQRQEVSALLGKLRRDRACGDAGRVVEVVDELSKLWRGDRRLIGNPTIWLMLACDRRGALADVPFCANGSIVFEVVYECGKIIKDDCEGAWEGFSGVIAKLLSEGATPLDHIYPAMQEIARKGPSDIKSAGFFDFAIRKQMRRAA